MIRYHLIAKTAPLVLAAALAGCGSSQLSLAGRGGYGVAAEPLDDTIIYPTPGSAKNTDNTDNTTSFVKVAKLVNDSEKKCNDFVNRLIASETGADTTLDIAATIFSALGTAFTPIATVHAFTAAGSIVSGSKTAVDADVFAKASIANFAQAIQSSYYGGLQIYLKNLPTDPTLIVPEMELPKIRSIHSQCALAPAEATISATLKNSTTTSTPSDNGATPPAPMPGPMPGPNAGSMPAPMVGLLPAPMPLAPSSRTQIFVPGQPLR